MGTVADGNLISEGTSHHFCCILFIRNRSLGPDDIKKEGLTQGHEDQEVGIIESSFRSDLSHLNLNFELSFGMGPSMSDR